MYVCLFPRELRAREDICVKLCQSKKIVEYCNKNSDAVYFHRALSVYIQIMNLYLFTPLIYTVAIASRSGIFRGMTDPEALLLQGRGCNSEGRPCGKRLRAAVKTEHIYLSLRLREKREAEQQTKRKEKRQSGENEDKKGKEEGREVHLGTLSCHFPS